MPEPAHREFSATSMLLMVNAIMFAFTLFSNFEDFLHFVGFFEFLVDRWKDVLGWFWRYIFLLLGLNIELVDIEQSTISMFILIFIPFLVTSAQARWIGYVPPVRASLQNQIRMVIFVPSILWLATMWNLSTYRMSLTAFGVFLISLLVIAIAVAIVARPWRPLPPGVALAFFSRLTVNAFYQIMAIAFIGCMYVMAKIVEIAPPFPK